VRSNELLEKEAESQEEDRKVWGKEQEDRKERVRRKREEERERKEMPKAGQIEKAKGRGMKMGFL
jgi:hypothetical protein